MSLVCIPSENSDFILSDQSRGCLPVRCRFIRSAGARLVLKMDYFAESWCVGFENTGDIDPFALIHSFDQDDLYDLFMVSNAIEEGREGALRNCILLLKEQAEIHVMGFNIPGWRDIATCPPKTSGTFLFGRFVSGDLKEYAMRPLASEQSFPIQLGEGREATHWFDPVFGSIDKLPVPTVTDVLNHL